MYELVINCFAGGGGTITTRLDGDTAMGHFERPNDRWPTVATILAYAGFKNGSFVSVAKRFLLGAAMNRRHDVRVSARPRLPIAGERHAAFFYCPNPNDRRCFMNAQSLSPAVSVVSGRAVVSSLHVADHFRKQHKDVLEAIRKLLPDLSPEFNERNFPPVAYVDAKGEKRPAYNLTRDGFTLLAMGFTGKRALAWKLRYIEAFNAMEKALGKSSVTPATLEGDSSLCLEAGAEYLKMLSENFEDAVKSLDAAQFATSDPYLRSIAGIMRTTAKRGVERLALAIKAIERARVNAFAAINAANIQRRGDPEAAIRRSEQARKAANIRWGKKGHG